MAQALFYSSNAVAMTLAAGIASGDVTCNLSSTSGLPASFPFKLLIGWGTAQQEVVHCTALSGVVATITRGQDGTTAQAHSIGATVVHGVSAREFNDLELHVGSTAAVHGITGSVVGTTDAQSLTNKTFDATSTVSGAPLVGTTLAQTLTNKTLTGAVLDAASTVGGVSGTTLAADHAAWTSFTPLYSNFTLGNGSVICHYLQIGKTVYYRLTLTIGSTSSATGAIQISLPAVPATGGEQWLVAKATGSSSLAGIALVSNSSQNLSVFLPTSTANCALTQWSGPIGGAALAAGMNLTAQGTYEAA